MTDPYASADAYDAATPEIALRRERTFGQVISDTLSVLGAHLGVFLPALFVVVALPLIGVLVVGVLAGPVAGAVLAGLASIPLFYVLMAAGYAYMLLYEEGFFVRGETLSAGALWAATKPLFVPVLSVQIAAGVVAALPILAIVALAAALESWGLGAALGAVWFCAVVYFSPGFSMATPVAIIEGEGPFSAIKRGVELVKGFWWQTFGVTVVASILSAVFAIPLSIAAGVAGVALDGPVGDGLNALLTSVGYVSYVVLIGATLLQYFNLVERKEGRQLDARIEEIGMEDDDEEPLF